MDALNSPTRASMVDGEYRLGNVGYGDQRVLTFDAATAANHEGQINSLASIRNQVRRWLMGNVGSGAQ